MAKHTLNSQLSSYKQENFPACGQLIPVGSLTPNQQSPLRNGTASALVQLNAHAARALLAYMNGERADIALVDVARNNAVAAEMPLANGDVFVAAMNRPDPQKNTLRLQAAIVGPNVGSAPRTVKAVDPISKTSNVELSPVFACLLPYVVNGPWGGITNDAEALAVQYRADGTIMVDEFCRVCDSLSVVLDQGLLNVNVAGGNIDLLSQTRLLSGALNGDVLFGKPDVLSGSGMTKKASSKATTFDEAKALFADYAKGRQWTAAERALIPQFPDDYPVAKEALEIAKKFVKTRSVRRPMNNFLWRGITSFGKSTGVELMAGFLNIPLLRMTCNSTMETQNFLSDIIPDTSNGVTAEMPSFEEISADPVSAYFKLTGIEDDDVTCQMALEAYGKAAAANNSVARYKFVESNYVKALEHGYIVEVQEISRIKDPGVLVGLNEYDRAGAMIPLVDGRFVRRHPDAMVVYTDNVGYASCRAVDPSVIRRCSFVIDSYEIPKKDLLARVVYNTGFSDKTLLDKMYTVWKAISEYCSENDITEGSVSATELEMWASAVMVDDMDNVVENCRTCVVSKATSVIEEQEDIMSQVVNVHLAN